MWYTQALLQVESAAMDRLSALCLVILLASAQVQMIWGHLLIVIGLHDDLMSVVLRAFS